MLALPKGNTKHRYHNKTCGTYSSPHTLQTTPAMVVASPNTTTLGVVALGEA